MTKPWFLPTAIVVLGLGFALAPLAQGRMFFHWDNAQQHYPQTVFLQEGLRQGTIPQWWPDVGLGFPATAEGQAAHYHPIRLLTALLLSAPAALMWELALYFAIAGLGTYFFLRELRLHRLACFLGAASQMFTGFAIVYVRNIALHRSFCLLPLAMLCAERFARRGDARSLLSASLVIGVQFLAGHPSFAIVTAVATGTYLSFRVLQQQWRGGRAIAATVRALLLRLAAWACAAALSLGVAAVQVFPTLLHAGQSQRQGGLTFESAVEVLPATVRGLGQLVLPYAYTQGDFLPQPASWGSFNPVPTAGIYCGAFCVVLAPVALWWRRRWPDAALPLAAAFVTAIGFALGPRAPLFPLLWSLPGMNGLRFPSRFLLWAAFCLSCLAAVGAHRLLAVGRLEARWTRKLAPLAIAGAAILALALAVSLQLPETRAGVAISIGTSAAALLLVSLLASARGPARAGVLLLAGCLAIGDLWWFRARGGYAPSVPIEEALKAPPAVDVIKQDPQPFRVLALTATEHGAIFTRDLRDYLQADLVTIWGVDSADVFLSLFLKRNYAVRLSIVNELLTRPEAAPSLAPFLGALNVKYVTAPLGTDLPGWQRVYETGRTAIWKNPAALPRAFLVGSVVPQRFELREEWRRRSDERLAEYRRDVSDWPSRAVDAQILDHVMARQVDYASTAEVLDADAIQVAGLDEGATVQTLSDRPDEMRFSVNTARPAFLVVSSSFYPGWTATLDGRPVRLHQTNWVTMGLQVPAGRSEIVLRYTTPGFRAGLVVSVTLWLVVGFLLIRPSPLARVLSLASARRAA